MKKTLSIFLLLCSYQLFFSQITQRDSLLLRLDDTIKDTLINSSLQVFVDPDNRLTIDSIQNPSFAYRFERLSDSFEIKDPFHVLWVRLEVYNTSDRAQEWVVWDLIKSNFLDAWISDPDSGWVHKKSGDYVAGRERSLNRYHLVAFDFTLNAGQRRTIYIKKREINHKAPRLKLRLLQKHLWEIIDMEEAIVAISSFVAILLIMFMYSLMVFFGTWERMYLYYSLYTLSIALFIMVASGPHQLKFNPIFNEYMLLISLCGLSIFYFQFGRRFLNLHTLSPRWDSILSKYIILRLIVISAQLVYLAITFNTAHGIMIELSFFLVDAVLSILLFVPLIRSKSTLAWFFIAGSAVVFVFGLTYLAISILVVEEDPNFIFFFLAIIIEILIFSLGLGYRMKRMERDKLQAKEAELQAKEELIEEQRKINSAFGRFVPDKFLSALGYKGILDVQLGDAIEKEVTVFFSDIRAYTTLAEQMTPQENFRFLNAYLGRVGPIIDQHGGFVNQYYGDGIMALFMDSPEHAVKTGIQIQQTLRVYNQERKLKNRLPIRMGIGIHSGPLMMGVIGDTLRMEAGVVSDTVNTASRMEGLTKYYGASILISESSLRKIENPRQFNFRYLGLVQVKGRISPMRIYEFFDGETEVLIDLRLKTQEAFESGITYYYQQQFAAAAEAFTHVLRTNPTDTTAQHYLHTATQLIVEGLPEGWTGVEMMMSK